MSEEIKEIAESLREISTPTGLSYSGDRTLDNSYTEKIIDFITNLQQKVEQLEKENKELKEENKRIFQNVNDDELLISNAMNYAELKKAEKKVEQLENIRKETIEELSYMSTDAYVEDYDIREKNYNLLMNILNKGSEE